MPESKTPTGGESLFSTLTAKAREAAPPSAGDGAPSSLTLELLQRLIGVEGEQSRLRLDLLERGERIKFLVLDNDTAEAELTRLEAELRAARDKIRELTVLGAQFSEDDFLVIEQHNRELEALILTLEATIVNLRAELAAAKEAPPVTVPGDPSPEVVEKLEVLRREAQQVLADMRTAVSRLKPLAAELRRIQADQLAAALESVITFMER